MSKRSRSNHNLWVLRQEVKQAVIDALNEKVVEWVKSGASGHAQALAANRGGIADEVVLKLHDRFRIGRPRRKAFESNPS